jgi:hypothetical protein
MLQALSQHITRRRIQTALGCLWFLDGALQLQHQMFTAQFANAVIAPAAQGQPQFVSSVMHFGIRIFLLHPALFNSLIALIQLGLGALILWERTTRAALYGSVAWGLFVWYVGEGLGGLFSGHTSLLMGAPGGALLYVIIALGVMSPRSKNKRDRPPAYWLAIAWAVLWLGGAVYQLLSGQNTAVEVGAMITGMASGAPGWLAALDLHVGSWVQGTGNWVILLLAAAQSLIGMFALLSSRLRATAVACGIMLSLVFWVLGQGLGGYYSGLATDPSTAPLFVLLGVAILGSKALELQLWD